MKIWYQVISSPTRLPRFLEALDDLCRGVAAPGTEVLIRGTGSGGEGDDFAAVRGVHAVEIVADSQAANDTADVYALANSLDPGLDSLRETLTIPVVSLLEVGFSMATMLGDRVGIIAPNPRFGRLYGNLVTGYGMSARLSGVEVLGFGHVPDLDSVFADGGAHVLPRLEEAAAHLRAGGAEVVIVPGPISCVLGREGIVELAGLPVLELFTALVKFAEAAATLARTSGFRTSRALRYGAVPASLKHVYESTESQSNR